MDRFDFPLFSRMHDSANGAGLMLLRESQNTSNRLRNAQIEDPEYATRESLSGYFHVACWLLLMAFCYTLSRFGCGWGIPSDCHPQDSLELANDMQMILLYGVLLMWFIGLLGHADSRSRFRWLFLSGRRTAAFCSLAALSGPSFAALGELRGLQASISPGSPMFNPRERAFWAMMTGFVLVTFALVWHVRHAWHLFHRNATRRTADRRQDSSPARSWHGERLSTQQSAVSHTDAGELRFALDDGGGSLSDENSRCSSSELAFSVAGLQPRRRSRRCCGQAGRSFWAYCVGRIGVLGFYVTYSLLASQRAHLHFHHYWIGLMVALWARFSHPLSATLLAVTTGIMCQGLACYNFAQLNNACEMLVDARGRSTFRMVSVYFDQSIAFNNTQPTPGAAVTVCRDPADSWWAWGGIADEV
jgi:hypothetical protein